jgi:hypothetical protein
MNERDRLNFQYYCIRMRALKLIGLLGISVLSYAQNYVDALRLEYTATPQNTFENADSTTDLQKANINLTVPLKLKNGNAIITGVVYDRVDTRLWEYTEKTPVSSYILKVGMNLKHSEKWSTTVLLLPKLASRFEKKVSRQDFQFGALGLAKMKKSEYMTYKFGAYVNGDKFGPFLVPLFGFYYKNEKLEMDVIVPSYAKINYSITPKVTAGINWRATVKSYNLNGPTVNIPANVIQPLYLHHLSNEVAAHVGFEPIKGVIVRGVAGLSLGRSFRVYQNDDKIDFGLSLFRFGDDRVLLNTDYDDGLFYRAEIAYRVYLD